MATTIIPCIRQALALFPSVDKKGKVFLIKEPVVAFHVNYEASDDHPPFASAEPLTIFRDISPCEVVGVQYEGDPQVFTAAQIFANETDFLNFCRGRAGSRDVAA